MKPPPPNDWIRRKRMSNSTFGAMAHSREPSMKRARQAINVDFLPITSLIFPTIGMVAVSPNW
jgi:hypothetical protein